MSFGTFFPPDPRINLKKSSKLSSDETLAKSQDQILTWWHAAFETDDALWERFTNEAGAALPQVKSSTKVLTPEDIFDGLMLQRATLKRDQQLGEWPCC